MEFWGVEVKAGETLKVSPGDGKLIHLSQASIGESKKGKEESVPVHVKIGEQKLVIGTLSADKFPQIQYDVVFEKDFELSHNWKNGSVYFCGYRAQNPEEDDEIYSGDDFDSDSEDEELPIENGKPEPVKADVAKPVAAGAGNSVGKIKQLAKDATVDSEEDSSDDDDLSDSDEEDLSDDDDMTNASSDEEEEKTPTPKKDNKKRPSESASKTPVPAKKGKVSTPQKSAGNFADGKKVTATHTATPHPAKQAAKTPKSDNPKASASAGKATCNSCSKTFNSEKALVSHSKAKHAK